MPCLGDGGFGIQRQAPPNRSHLCGIRPRCLVAIIAAVEDNNAQRAATSPTGARIETRQSAFEDGSSAARSDGAGTAA
jgi:hypothetical protein